MNNKNKPGRPPQLIKPISRLPFDIEFDFMINNGKKYKNNKKVINTIKRDKHNDSIKRN